MVRSGTFLPLCGKLGGLEVFSSLSLCCCPCLCFWFLISHLPHCHFTSRIPLGSLLVGVGRGTSSHCLLLPSATSEHHSPMSAAPTFHLPALGFLYSQCGGHTAQDSDSAVLGVSLPSVLQDQTQHCRSWWGDWRMGIRGCRTVTLRYAWSVPSCPFPSSSCKCWVAALLEGATAARVPTWDSQPTAVLPPPAANADVYLHPRVAKFPLLCSKH